MYFVVLRILKRSIVKKNFTEAALKKLFDNIPKFADDKLFVDKTAENNFKKNLKNYHLHKG